MSCVQTLEIRCVFVINIVETYESQLIYFKDRAFFLIGEFAAGKSW